MALTTAAYQIEYTGYPLTRPSLVAFPRERMPHLHNDHYQCNVVD